MTLELEELAEILKSTANENFRKKNSNPIFKRRQKKDLEEMEDIIADILLQRDIVYKRKYS